MAVAIFFVWGCASSKSVASEARAELRAGALAAQHNYWQEALFRFERAKELQPGRADVLNDLAVALEALGRYDDALATYKQALGVAPRSTELKKNYARFAEFYTSYAKGVQPKKEDSNARH